MQGSHSPYEIRSPKSFKKFKSEYNNSILYSDYVLSSIINYIIHNIKKETYLFYVSDHGELLNEKGHKGHGWFEPEVYKVPFIFASNRPISKEMMIQLKNIKSHYDISSTITKLLGYDTSIDSMSKKTIYINGSDLDALGGFIKFDIEDGEKISLRRNN
jgi:glucan phosphoethanolaminetransferase (alkaline phosphatase superfamily)